MLLVQELLIQRPPPNCWRYGLTIRTQLPIVGISQDKPFSRNRAACGPGRRTNSQAGPLRTFRWKARDGTMDGLT